MLYRFLKISCLILLLLAGRTNLWAQHPPVWQITDEDGLPSMEVYDVYQDTKGYIWFATELGICRYDGNLFKRYATPTARSKGMTNISEDKQGKVWFMNFSKQIFYIEHEQVKEFAVPVEFKKEQYRLFDVIVNTKSGYIYLQTSTEIFEFNPQAKTWKSYGLMPNGGAIWGITQDDKGTMWYMENNRILWKHTLGKGPIEVFRNRKKNGLGGGVVFLGDLWNLGHKGSEILLIRDGKTIPVFDQYKDYLKDLNLTKFTRDREGNYWILGFNGGYCFTDDFKPYRGGLHILPGKVISNILQDREGNYWITTLRSGVYFMPSKEVLYYNDDNSVLEDKRVNCLAIDEMNNLFLGGTNGKISVFNPEKGITFQYSVGQIKEIEAMHYDKAAKKLYVSSYGFKVFRQGEKKPWDFYRKSNYRQSPRRVSRDGGVAGSAPKFFARYGSQHLLSASATGIYVIRTQHRPNELPPLNEVFRKQVGFKSVSRDLNYINYNVQNLLLRRGRTRAVWGDTIQQRIWAGCSDGLYYYNMDGVGKQLTDKQNKHGLYALSINQTPNGLIWVGTMEHGLYGIRDTSIVYHYNTDNGLVSNYCKVLRPDGNKVWLGTDQGIQLIDPQKSSFRLFNQQDGLITNEIRDLIIQNNKVWVATTKGLLVFNKDEMRENDAFPPIYITRVSIWDKEVPLKDAYELDYDQNNLKIDFKGLAYRSRGRFRYKYRMLGLDSSWVTISSFNNFARYSAIPHGTYEFEVKAVNEDNVESEGIAVLQIKMHKHYTQTWWFILLVVLAGLAVISAFFLLHIRNLKREGDIKQDLRSSQLSALKVQMNPHFIFNALNSIQEFILLNEKRLANAFLGKFADLMRLTLDMSNEKQVELVEELKVLRLYLELEAVRFEDTFEYTIDIHPEIDPEEILIPSMLIQPYIENAIKHGLLHKKENRKLQVSFSKSSSSDLLCCEVVDNGIGRKASWELKSKRKTQHKSFAMSATRKRLELLNHGRKAAILVSISDLEDSQGNALGTRVYLKIPIDSTFN